MLHRLSEIARSTVTVEGDDLSITDLWIDPKDGRLRYLGVDVGSWLSHRTALVSVERVATRDGPWTANLTREEVESATFQPEGGFRLDMTDLPPILTGPFGNTISPLLISAGLKSSAARTLPPIPEGDHPSTDNDPTAPDVLTRALETPRDWIGRPVFARDGEIGEAQDILVDDEDWSLAAVLVGHVARPPHPIPWEAIRHVADHGAHLVVAADMETLRSAPALPGPDDAPRAWRAMLAEHYNIAGRPAA